MMHEERKERKMRRRDETRKQEREREIAVGENHLFRCQEGFGKRQKGTNKHSQTIKQAARYLTV